MSTQTERDEMSRLFGCPVLDEYSSEELTRIAAQCVHLTYHVFEDINYMEVVDEEGRLAQGPGVLVGTNLHNKAMPIIRYLQNDLGFIETRIAPATPIPSAPRVFKAERTTVSCCPRAAFYRRVSFWTPPTNSCWNTEQPSWISVSFNCAATPSFWRSCGPGLERRRESVHRFRFRVSLKTALSSTLKR
jgi:hypothetical protein